ncbi:MAG: bifunctional folylpolyglutamate synthase/dihydrofolate synthase [Ruminococcaceae bacterium]|nr:bifunctional folylpolyglutamate synthase/dihydrofolate synthase [Oscillospiraceae bacterium]
MKNAEFKSYANSFQAVTVPGLERIAAMLSELGNPERGQKFIHIAGTNGKGSTAANMTEILRAAGYKVGKYISPNLLRVNERISINGCDISDSELSRLLDRVQPAADAAGARLGQSPTQFEIWTAAAFLYFKESGCDYVVLEVGLGGEFDATNVIEENEIAIITRLGLDHTQYLGDSIESVARAKAGIIKARSATRAVITVRQEDTAAEVIRKVASEKGCTVTEVSPEPRGTNEIYEVFDLGEIKDIVCGISGYHQIENAALAAAAAEKLGISHDAIRRGIRSARNPARFELISDTPVVIYDGGHNENGIEALTRSIERYFGNEPKTVIFACMADKDIKNSLRMLSENETEFIFTTVRDNPRAMTAKALAARASDLGFSGVAFEDIGEAYEEARRRSRLTVICGSLYLYKDLKEYLERK